MKNILILNRGEIACRLIQAAQELGYKATAIYSDPDRGSRHVELADKTIHLAGSSPQETYLNIEKIIPLAKAAGCTAVHPGYGFLSERAHAAEAFAAAGMVWIGPSPQSIRLLGDKLEAKKLLEKYSVPTAPWGEVDLKDVAALTKLAEKIGFPVLLKAASGGGGKGMRLVKKSEDLEEAANSAAREAKSSFGDATLLVEKYLEEPRHIEIQILGDLKGNLVHFGERECSLQRRHQKVVEEAPASHLSAAVKNEIAECAVRLAKGVGYANAGTVEFLVDKNEGFYFLEVNSRLQVEHSVTEAVWGIDLVKLQIEIAHGKTLPELFDRDNMVPRGHAIQSRIYAEDAANQYAPCPGPLALVEWPQAVGLRIDTGVRSGSVIGLDYDAMIAKLTVHADSRASALQRMLWCLRHTVLFGTTTNINYLIDVLSHAQVQSGKVDVKFLEREFGKWKDAVPKELLAQRDELVKNSSTAATTKENKSSHSSPWETL